MTNREQLLFKNGRLSKFVDTIHAIYLHQNVMFLIQDEQSMSLLDYLENSFDVDYAELSPPPEKIVKRLGHNLKQIHKQNYCK